MPLIECPDCHNQISDAAPACPKCGRPNDKKPELPTEDKRTVSIQLIAGIMILPLIFSWFTLKKGYSTTARVLSFVWLLLFLVFALSGESKNTPEQSAPAQTAETQPSELSSDVKPAAPAPAEPAPVEPAKPAPEATFDLTPNAFKTKFNRIIKQVDPDFAIKKFVTSNGEVNDTINYQFSDIAGMVGSIDKTSGKIKSLTFITSGTKRSDEVMLIIAVPIAMSQVVNPDEDRSELANTMVDMMTTALNNIDNGGTIERQLGNVGYTVLASKTIGMFISMSPEKP